MPRHIRQRFLRNAVEGDVDALGQGLVHRLEVEHASHAGALLPGLAQLLQRGDKTERINIALYRVAQEALTNVTRHAQASQVRLTLARDAAGHVCLTIADDGRGMAPAGATRGLGLLGAGERAAALGGELHIDSAPGAGVRLTLRIPAPRAAAPALGPVTKQERAA